MPDTSTSTRRAKPKRNCRPNAENSGRSRGVRDRDPHRTRCAHGGSGAVPRPRRAPRCARPRRPPDPVRPLVRCRSALGGSLPTSGRAHPDSAVGAHRSILSAAVACAMEQRLLLTVATPNSARRTSRPNGGLRRRTAAPEHVGGWTHRGGKGRRPWPCPLRSGCGVIIAGEGDATIGAESTNDGSHGPIAAVGVCPHVGDERL